MNTSGLFAAALLLVTIANVGTVFAGSEPEPIVHRATRPAPIQDRCYQCHKSTGKSFVDEVITITGQNKEYLINQLYRYRSGERQERLIHYMNTIAGKLTDDEIERLAAFFSAQNPRILYETPIEFEKMTENDRRLYEIGKTHAVVCLSCHADAETSPPKRSDWPYISGQNRPALAIQLYAFAKGKRVAPEMAFLQSPPFNDPDVIEGLALYFSRLQPPGEEPPPPPPQRRRRR